MALRKVIESVLGVYQSAGEELSNSSCVEQLCLGLERVIELFHEQPGLLTREFFENEHFCGKPRL